MSPVGLVGLVPSITVLAETSSDLPVNELRTGATNVAPTRKHVSL
jgi:hypothetical protein